MNNYILFLFISFMAFGLEVISSPYEGLDYDKVNVYEIAEDYYQEPCYTYYDF